jgi:hypothetical protein
VDTSENGPTVKQREKRRGIAAESLVASMCVLGSDGELNFATSLVDDEGVDLVFYRSAGGPTLSVQVKSHFFDSPGKIERRRANALLNPGTFRPRRDLYLLFLVVDQYEARIKTAWLVPSVEFSESKRGKNLRFQASPDPGLGSPWEHYLVDHPRAEELADRIARVLDGLE